MSYGLNLLSVDIGAQMFSWIKLFALLTFLVAFATYLKHFK